MPPVKRWLNGHTLVFAFCALVLTWMATEGDWNLFAPAGFLEGFYDGQAQSLLHLRIDVDPDAIGPEGMIHDGKWYGYFGPTPALFRLQMRMLLPAMNGRWHRLSVLMASLLALGLAVWLYGMVERRMGLEGHPRLRGLLLGTMMVAVSLGSSELFLCAEAKVYQEALAWGSTLALASGVLLIRHLDDGREKWLACSCAAAFFAWFARVPMGGGAVVSLAVVAAALLFPKLRPFWGVPADASIRRAMALLAATIVLTCALHLGLNYAKWGDPLVTIPFQYHVQYANDPARLARTGGQLFSPGNLGLTLWGYLWPGNIRFAPSFPWIYAAAPDPGIPGRFPSAKIDKIEPWSVLPPTEPELFLAALAGIALCVLASTRNGENGAVYRAPLLGMMAGGSVTLMLGFLSERYLQDSFPWVATAAVIGVAHIPRIAARRWRYAATGLFLAATAYAVWTNFSLAIMQQRVFAYPVPPKSGFRFWTCGMRSTADRRSGFRLSFRIGGTTW